MSNDRIKILGIDISSLNSDQILEYIEKYLENFKFQISNFKLEGAKPLIIFTPNPEIIVYSQKDPVFKKIVNSAQINLPDGQGLIWAAKILGLPLKGRISGADFMEELAKMAAKKGLTVGLIGGGKGIAVKALECLQEKYPGLNGWAEEGPTIKFSIFNFQFSNPHIDCHSRHPCHSRESGNLGFCRKTLDPRVPYRINKPEDDKYNYDYSSLLKKIQKTKTSFLFVGLGAPKQEYFIANLQFTIYNLSRRLRDPAEAGQFSRPLVLMSVGGSFDYLAKNVPRAPKVMRLIGFEWLFRLFRQPRRIKRQLSLLKFTWLVAKQKLATKGIAFRG